MTIKTTISLIKCDVGSLAGHYIVPSPLFNIAEKNLKQVQETGLINNYHVFNAGDNLQLLMVHQKGESDPEIHSFRRTTTARRLGLSSVKRQNRLRRRRQADDRRHV